MMVVCLFTCILFVSDLHEVIPEGPQLYILLEVEIWSLVFLDKFIVQRLLSILEQYRHLLYSPVINSHLQLFIVGVEGENVCDGFPN